MPTDTKISALTDGTTAEATDRIPVARDAGGGAFNNRYVTPGYIGTTLLGSGSALTGATVTTSQPVLNLSQTWNAGAVTFTGLKFNATDTASAAASLLLDLQVGGVSQVNIDKTAVFNLRKSNSTGVLSNLWMKDNYNVSIGSYAGSWLTFGINPTAGLLNGMGMSATELRFPANFSISWTGSGALQVAADLFITRGNAATLQLGAADAAAPVAQTLQVQGVVAGTSNTAGANFTIRGSDSTGNAAGGSIIFQVSPAGSSGTAQNAYATALTINSDRTATFASNIIVPRASSLIFSDTWSYLSLDANTQKLNFAWVAAYQPTLQGTNTYLALSNGLSFGWASGAAASSSPDLLLSRDAADTLALRRTTTAGPTTYPQTFRVYNNFDGTVGGNNEYGTFDWSTSSNVLTIGTVRTGTGTARDLRLAANSGIDGYINLSANSTITLRTNTQPIVFSTATGYTPFAVGYVYVQLGGSVPLAWTSTEYGATGTADTWLYRGAAGVIGINGKTASFPALKNSGATLQVRLANDSAFAPLSCGNTTASGTALDVSGTGAASIFNVTNTTTGTLLSVVNSSSSTIFSVADTPAITLIDAMTIAVGTTTGTKIGTATSQKIGFWNKAPIVQPTTGVAEATFVENSGGTAVNVDSTFGGYTLQQVVQALQNVGLLA